MQQPVSNNCRVNNTRLRIGYFENSICGMGICFCRKIDMKRNNICHEISLKLLHIVASSFSFRKFCPRREQIFKRNDIIKCMLILNSGHNETPPSPRILPVLGKVKESYLLWYKFYHDLPKTHRYTLGQRIDTLFIEIIEAIAAASFLSREEKHPYVRLAIKKMDTLRVLLMILWETKSLDSKKYIALSVKLDEAGRMLGGWNGQLAKQNSPVKTGEK